jgi:hypothetical protein
VGCVVALCCAMMCCALAARARVVVVVVLGGGGYGARVVHASPSWPSCTSPPSCAVCAVVRVPWPVPCAGAARDQQPHPGLPPEHSLHGHGHSGEGGESHGELGVAATSSCVGGGDGGGCVQLDAHAPCLCVPRRDAPPTPFLWESCPPCAARMCMRVCVPVSCRTCMQWSMRRCSLWCPLWCTPIPTTCSVCGCMSWRSHPTPSRSVQRRRPRRPIDGRVGACIVVYRSSTSFHSSSSPSSFSAAPHPPRE